MVKKLELLSPNLVLILKEVLNIQNICKLLYYNQTNPLSQPNLILPANNLMFNLVFPYPFNPDVTIQDCSQLRIYYPSGQLKNNEIVGDINLIFDIIVAKNLWLINDGDSKIRPYEIISELISYFSKNSINTVGRLHFERFNHLTVNEKFDALRLIANMIIFE